MTITTERRTFIQGAGLVAAAASTAALAASPAFAQSNQPSGAKTMPYQAKPMSLDPKSIKGISEKVLVSHYENNYVGAVKRLNAIGAQLAELDFAKAPNFMVNGLKREELIAANSRYISMGSAVAPARAARWQKLSPAISAASSAGARNLSRWARQKAVAPAG
jgi:superoxide dismutase, Fe-Mn family